MATKKVAAKPDPKKKAKGAPARKKKAPPKPAIGPVTSPIVLAVLAALKRKPFNPPKQAALAVLMEMAKDGNAQNSKEVLQFLDYAYQQVMSGGGSDGNEKAGKWPPEDDPTTP